MIQVYLIRLELNEQDEEWAQVIAEGIRGYIKWEFIRNDMTIEESREYDAAQATPAPVFTEEDLREEEPETPTPAPSEEPTETIPTEEPTEAPTEIITEEPTAVPTDEPTATPTAAPTPAPTPEPVELDEIQNRYVTTSNNVNLREKASTGSALLKKLKANTKVYLIRLELNEL